MNQIIDLATIYRQLDVISLLEYLVIYFFLCESIYRLYSVYMHCINNQFLNFNHNFLTAYLIQFVSSSPLPILPKLMANLDNICIIVLRETAKYNLGGGGGIMQNRNVF